MPRAIKEARRLARRRRRRRVRFRYLQDIRYVSKRRWTRIVLVVNQVVQIEKGEAPAAPARKLPPRIYFDLTPCLPGTVWQDQPLALKDKRVRRIRVGRNTLRTTRVVLELSKARKSRVTILPDPVRIVIDVADRRLPPSPNAKMPLPTARPLPPFMRGRRTPPHARHTPSSPNKPYVLRYKGRLRLPFPYRVRRIAIDAGHGGVEHGAVGKRYGLKEKDVTLDVAKRVIVMLRKRYQIEAFLTRRQDQTMSLQRRAALVKKRRADLLISIHINAHPERKLQGISTYFLNWNHRYQAAKLFASDALTARENRGVNPRSFQDVQMILQGLQAQTNTVVSRILSVALQRGLIKRVRRSYPRIRDLGVRRGLFYVLFAAEVPGVLVEASYLSNPYEEKLLRTRRYRGVIARGIADGVGRFLRVTMRGRPRKRSRKPRKRSARRRRRRVSKRGAKRRQ